MTDPSSPTVGSTKAVFVGVNKHEDAQISELSGACKDATALWALFSDTIPDLSAHLLLDEHATLENVRSAITKTLEDARADDVVIITFAGHGSPTGSLVLYDTKVQDVAGTSFAMHELAELFKTSKARAILCVVDCCFSGNAPARVLEMEGTPRNAFVLNEISGEGRILLAACGTDELAWEQPGTGHGLLTYALIQAMSNEALGAVQFPDIAGDIVRSAKLAATQMFVTQTPVFLGSIQGGLAFPVLRKGPNYLASFPPTVTLTLTGPFHELRQVGLPQEVTDAWTAKFPNGLNELQLEALNKRDVLAGAPLLVVAPTSSGKTMIGEVAALQAVTAGRKAAFLLPYRALVSEKYDEFTERYEEIGLRVMRCSGDTADDVGAVLSGRYDLAFFTYETFLNLALISPRLLNQLGLVVLDEGQFITDPNRGITVELILSLLLRARERGVHPQLIFLSAVIGALNGLDKWLGLSVLASAKRPVPLMEGVIDRHGTWQFLDGDGATRTEQLIPGSAIVQRRDKPSAQDVIVPLAKTMIANGEKFLVFRNIRGLAQGCAAYLADELGLPPAQDVIDSLPTQDLTGSSAQLVKCLRGGTAFHNTNLLRAEREVIERAFRDPKGSVHVLAATTTLAAGINTPASTVILAENEFKGEDGRPFTVAEYKNMAGRAGRLGFNEIGKSIIYAETPIERATLFRKYVLGKPEDVVSSFQDQDLPTWTLRLLSQVRRLRAEDVPLLLVNTFAGFSRSQVDPRWADRVKEKVAAFVTRLIHAGLAEVEGDLLHLTLLGRACGNSSLSFESSLRLVEVMKEVDISATPPSHFVAMIQVLQEMDDLYTPLFKRGQTESGQIAKVAQKYTREISWLLQRYASGDSLVYWGRCKRAALTWDWMEGVPVEDIERNYTTNPFQGAVNYGDVIRIVEGCRFHLRSAHQILAALFAGQPEYLERLDATIKQLEFGLPASSLALLDLSVRLSRGQYLALIAAGCTTVADVERLSDQQLVEALGPSTSQRLRPSHSGIEGT